MNKVIPSVEAALADIRDGARIMVGGFGPAGVPETLVDGVLDQGARGLTVISNNAGHGGVGLAAWVRQRRVARVICTYIGDNTELHDAMADGSVQVDVMPQGTFIEAMRAAGAGIPAFYTATGVGTVVAEGAELRDFSGKTHLLAHALHADVALIRAHIADAHGNCRFWRAARNFSDVMATAATTTIVEAATVVAAGQLDPDDVHLPGIFVQRVVEVPR